MHNLELAEILNEIADLLEIKGENPYKIRAYRRGAQAVSLLAEDVSELVKTGRLRRVEGIGDALEAKIREWVEQEEIAYHQRLLREIPRGLIEVMQVPGIGPKLAQRLFAEIGVGRLEDLEEAIKDGRLQRVRGLGPKAQARIERGLERMAIERGRTPLAEALTMGMRILHVVREAPGVTRAELAGSLRRRRESVGDLDIVASAADPQPVMERFVSYSEVREVLAQGSTKSSVHLYGGMQVDLRVVQDEAFASALHHFTGSQAHHIRLREWAQKRGWRVSEYGLEEIESGRVVTPPSEEALYRTLGLPYIPPELREDRGEFELALVDRLPCLVELDHLRGDLHTHSTWSDGSATIEEMVRAARDLGWSYLAICDHSQSLRIAGGLGVDDLKRQREEIERVREAVEGIRLLWGIEVDVLYDGRLDLPDAALEPLDVVVASIHSGLSNDRERMTERLVRALEHPLVDIIGHPTGRRIGHRPPYELDFDRVLAAAAENSKALEINASPGRLDLNDELAGRAVKAGVWLSVNTDAHSIEELATMPFGLWVARRAGAEPDRIINTLTAEQIQTWRAQRIRG